MANVHGKKNEKKGGVEFICHQFHMAGDRHESFRFAQEHGFSNSYSVHVSCDAHICPVLLGNRQDILKCVDCSALQFVAHARYPPQALILQLDPLIESLPTGWESRFLVLDCFSDSSGQGELIFSDFYDAAPSWIRKVPSLKNPKQFHRFLGRIEREFVTPGTRLVFNSLSLMEHLWDVKQ